MTCACGKEPDPGICPADCGPGLPAGGHCSCVHQEKAPDAHVVASAYTVSLLPDGHEARKYLCLEVRYMGHRRWSVMDGPQRLARDGTWDSDRPPPENREEWRGDYLFDFNTAMTLARAAARDLQVNGRHVLDILKETT